MLWCCFNDFTLAHSLLHSAPLFKHITWITTYMQMMHIFTFPWLIFSLNQLQDCLQNVFNWMTNKKLKLNANKTDKSSVLNLIVFFPAPMLSQNFTPAISARNLAVAFNNNLNFRQRISQTCLCCFYHIHDLRLYSRFNKICHPNQRTRWQVDKEAIGLSRVQQCSSTCNPPS